MNFSTKGTEVIKDILSKLKANSFDEDDVARLLRYLRPNVLKNSIIWELACFIAHTEERTKGRFKDNLDLIYAKAKYGPMCPKTPDNTINPECIPRKLFDTLLVNGIEEFDEDKFKERSGIQKERALQLIRGSYQAKNKAMVLMQKSKLPEMKHAATHAIRWYHLGLHRQYDFEKWRAVSNCHARRTLRI